MEEDISAGDSAKQEAVAAPKRVRISILERAGTLEKRFGEAPDHDKSPKAEDAPRKSLPFQGESLEQSHTSSSHSSSASVTPQNRVSPPRSPSSERSPGARSSAASRLERSNEERISSHRYSESANPLLLGLTSKNINRAGSDEDNEGETTPGKRFSSFSRMLQHVKVQLEGGDDERRKEEEGEGEKEEEAGEFPTLGLSRMRLERILARQSGNKTLS